MKRIHVVAAVIRRGQQILIARRPAHVHMGGLWEFPGGKLEPGEVAEQALVRELQEELAITPQDFTPLIRIAHDYSDKSVLLDVWTVHEFSGKPVGREGQAIAWVSAMELADYEFPAANRPIVSAARLPALCHITGGARDWQDYCARLSALFSLDNGVVILRPEDGYCPEPQQLAAFIGSQPGAASIQWQWHSRWRERCGEESLMTLVHSQVNFGLHLTADELINPPQVNFRTKLSASCHSAAELAKAAKSGAEFALLSPLAATKTYGSGALLGWSGFQALTDTATIPVYALGGLNAGDINAALRHGGQGVAMIRGWW